MTERVTLIAFPFARRVRMRLRMREQPREPRACYSRDVVIDSPRGR